MIIFFVRMFKRSPTCCLKRFEGWYSFSWKHNSRLTLSLLDSIVFSRNRTKVRATLSGVHISDFTYASLSRCATLSTEKLRVWSFQRGRATSKHDDGAWGGKLKFMEGQHMTTHIREWREEICLLTASASSSSSDNETSLSPRA
jgi:hypothetical protein